MWALLKHSPNRSETDVHIGDDERKPSEHYTLVKLWCGVGMVIGAGILADTAP